MFGIDKTAVEINQRLIRMTNERKFYIEQLQTIQKLIKKNAKKHNFSTPLLKEVDLLIGYPDLQPEIMLTLNEMSAGRPRADDPTLTDEDRTVLNLSADKYLMFLFVYLTKCHLEIREATGQLQS